MKSFILALILTLASRALAADPSVILIEAENSSDNRADIIVQADPAASGGKFITVEGAYKPLYKGEWPALESESLTLWVHVRGYAVQAKIINADNSQTELPWNWTAPPTWRWVNLGTYSRADLGVGFLLICSDSAPSDAGLDALIVATDPAFRPQIK